ncbi:hypothetical protein M406DRAFT_342881 [Cryphonectria parasitica EP155]|uniref:Uncharacterized protein n=1 Tax=Cryphonectria parasitica (strain ATCC 38755 / EP155) TaxID=660469 RepID=A0A9P4XSU1_CRYP1|nr:uncharacterized protein M406DRAFT_342881 [Cryphonectria parasitica EP155]KAF3760674.1 hypothetical protein M406DRAFT_342881 [Cryphonectria parasitica EP155]
MASSHQRLQDAFERQKEKNLASSLRPSSPGAETKTFGPRGDRQILVAIDFGTTYSAAAWVHTQTGNAQRPPINIIHDWPEKADTTDSVPT